MIVRCDKCKKTIIPKGALSISNTDALGFLFLSAILLFPIWGISAALEGIPFLAYLIAFTTIAFYTAEKEYKVVGVLLAELAVDVALIYLDFYTVGLFTTTAFILTFYRIGRRIYGFFFKFVNYELRLIFKCRRCKRIINELKLPNDPIS